MYPHLRGCNVTIPYKSILARQCTVLVGAAKELETVNTIVYKDDEIIGYNTDTEGFSRTLPLCLSGSSTNTLVLGTGGAAKAVAYVLRERKVQYQLISRTAERGAYTYSNLPTKVVSEAALIVNCTPLGTTPSIHQSPPLKWFAIAEPCYFYDTVYIPEKTKSMKLAQAMGAKVQNGSAMLRAQADAAWEKYKT